MRLCANIFALIILSFLTQSAQATLTMSPVQVGMTPFNVTTNTIYLGGTSAGGSCSGVYCNSCATVKTLLTSTAPLPVCSLFEVHGTDNFTLNVTTNSTTVTLNTTGNIFYYSVDNSSWFPVAGEAVSSATQATVQLLLNGICGKTTTANPDSLCHTSFSQTLYIGVGPTNPPTETGSIQLAYRYVDAANTSYAAPASFDCNRVALQTDGEGVCSFTVYPGDSKTFINNVEVDPSNLTLTVPNLDTNNVTGSDPSNMVYAGLAIFAIDNADVATMSTASDEGTMTIIPTGKALVSPSPTYIDGLTNGTTYAIGYASVDQAGILTFFDVTGLTVTPDPVYGLLSGQGCFIATAAYGSSMAPEVDTFREFRGRILMSSKFGRWLSHNYYKYSPPFAEFIAQSETLKFISRLILWPLLLFVKLSLKFGFGIASLLVGLLIFVGLGAGLFLRRRRLRRLA